MAERTIIVTSADATTVRYQTDATTVVTTDATGPQGPQGAAGAGINTLTTKGDLLGYSTEGARIPVGTNTHVLTADSTQALGVKWAAPDVTQVELDAAASAAAAALAAHESDTTSVHGITDTSAILLKTLVDAKGDLIVASAADTPARLAVGTNGHVLTADSAESTGVKWAAASGGGGGEMYNATASKYGAGPTKSLFWPGASFAGWNQAAPMTANALHYQPGYAAKSITLSAIKFELFSAATAGKVMRVGLYVADDDWQPTTLIVDSGAIAADSTGVKTYTTSAVVPAGRILAVVHSDGAPQLRICGIPNWGQVRGDLFGGGSNIAHVGWLTKTGVTYAALPSSGTAWTTVDSSSHTATAYCAVLLEAASYS